MFPFLFFICVILKHKSCYIAQAVLELTILLLLSHERWDCRCVSINPAILVL